MRRYWLLLARPSIFVPICLVLLGLIGAGGTWHILTRQEGQRRLAMIHEASTAVEEPVRFPVTRIMNYAHPAEYRQVQQAGVDGVKRRTYSVKTRGDGSEVSREQTAEAVVLEPVAQIEVVGARLPNALTKARGAQQFRDTKGVVHRETYYDLPMNVVMGACGAGGHYSVREDGAKIDKDGYVIVAANYSNYPRCSVVETSLGPGKVYDTGGFAKVHPHGFDLATDWTNGDGR